MTHKWKVGREKGRSENHMDLETLLHMSYEFNTTAFLTMVGYSEEEAQMLLGAYAENQNRKVKDAFDVLRKSIKGSRHEEETPEEEMQ